MEYFAYLQKSFIYKYVVMLSDTDQFEHMSFANYLKLMFLSSDALFLSCCDASFLSKYRLKLSDSRMQFKKQTIAGNHILIKVNSSHINNSGFSLLFTFVTEEAGHLVGLGRQTYQMVDRASDSLRPLTESVQCLLNPIEVNEEYLLYKY